MAKKKTYYDYLRAELGELLDQLQLETLQKQSLKRRWLDQAVWADKKADECRRMHHRLRLTTIIGGVILPALVGLNMQLDRDSPISRWFPYVPFALSQVVAVSAALAEFGSYGDRWRTYRKMSEDLKAEGWNFLQLSGAYESVLSHQDGYAMFAGQVENVIKSDVKSYIDALQQKQSKEEAQVQQIVAAANAVAKDERLFARPKPVETLPPAPMEERFTDESAIATPDLDTPEIVAGSVGILEVIQDTVLKLDTVSSNELPDTHKVMVLQGRKFGLQGQEEAAKNHLKVTLTEQLGIGNYDTWYVYAPHAQITDSSGVILSAVTAPVASEPVTPESPIAAAEVTTVSVPTPTFVNSDGSIKLSVPYYSQLDNLEQALRTCNTSSCAMVAKFLGAKISGDDEYFTYVKKYGDTTDHHVQTDALKDISIKSTWNTNLDFDDLDKSLASGLPVVIGILHHGSLDAPSGGHMVVVVGRTAKGDYLIHDPYGDLNSDYQIENGEYLTYSKNILNARWLERTKCNGWGRLFYDNIKPAAAPTAQPTILSLSLQNTAPKPLSVATPAVVNGNGAIKLSVLYFSQRDNLEEADRTCNTSSCAMVAKFLGAKISGDDEYFSYVKRHGDTTDHGVQTLALQDLGIKSTWNTNLEFADLDKSLMSGLPIVIGILHRGSVENPQGFGHMVVVVGRTLIGDYLVHDPYGDLNSNYNDTNGEYLTYSRHALTNRWTVEGKNTGYGRLFYDNIKPAAERAAQPVMLSPSIQIIAPKPLSVPTPASQMSKSGGGIPACGVELIKHFEGYHTKLPDGSAQAYADPKDGWALPTIGYGNTRYPDGRKVQQGDIITHAQAEEYLIWHISEQCKPNLEKIPTWSKMNDNQRGAIYSFAYNLGDGFYGDSDFGSITKVCDSLDKWKDAAWIEAQFVKYCNPGSSVEEGLRKRRIAEAKLFCS